MTRTCPRCRRKLVDAADLADAPLFCMYCGQKLRSAEGARPAVADVEDVPGLDDPTMAYAPTPPEGNETTAPGPVPAEGGESPPDGVSGFRFVRFIGAGGMGSVYEAEHDETGHRVAIKLLSGRLAANPASVERFKQEGRVASQISHPHCVFVLGADTDAGRPYIVMELMPGRTLKDIVDRKGPLPVGEAVARILDVIDGLAEAHRLGVIHRDVKPSNCFLTDDDRVKIGDFGLSKSLASDPGGRQITQSGAFLGTVLFASPEQIRGESVGYESDVYAVCGTLYYLLTGRAPYQHESLTASLAKAVSEPPPPIRPKRPDVSAELERIILRGLDRDRDRRWQSLDDLRDALSDQQPERQRPARPRALIMAYLTDWLILASVGLVLSLVQELTLNLSKDDFQRWLQVGWQDFVLAVLYFGLFEGLLGWSPGKRLLRLRVARVGQTGPPGVPRAALRALVFNAVWYAIFILPQVLFLLPVRPAGPLLAMTSAAIGLMLLLRQLWRSPDGWRGVHDFASGCRVVQRPRPGYRLRLVSHAPSPLTRIQPSPTPLPASVGGFGVTGKLCDLPDGGEVWVGEDRSLGRRVLVRVLPPGQEDPYEGDVPVNRPTRLRVLGHGTVDWAGGERGWVACVAPAGAPLVDVVGPDRRLSWAETRPILEQLAGEFSAAADGSGVPQPGVEQVWVEPGGRVQLLDYPLPCGPGEGGRPVGAARPSRPTGDPLDFLRQVTTLALEGRPRSARGRVEAPVPPHASLITDRLLAGGYKSTADLAADLAENHTHPPQVTASLRAAHLSGQSAILSFGLIFMFGASGLFGYMMAFLSGGIALETEHHLAIVRDDRAREQLLARARAEVAAGALTPDTAGRLEAALAPHRLPETQARLETMVKRRRAAAEEQRGYLTRPELTLLDHTSQLNESEITGPQGRSPASVASTIWLAEEAADSPAVDLNVLRRGVAIVLSFIILACPLVWVAFAFAFRGGLSMNLAGLTLVRADGRPAGRFRCALRVLLVWAPVVVLLLLSLWVQEVAPERVFLRSALWLTGLLLLPVYVMLALRDPPRPPHDRLVGTYIVPA